MNKFVFFNISIALVSCLDAMGQVNYEKGYFITNEGLRKECLIKNIDWKDNPDNFQYKDSAGDHSKKMDISTVKEFRVYGYNKYIRKTVNIDRSATGLEELGRSRNPDWKQEQLFLKVLIEGHASLYKFEDNDLKRFFFSADNDTIQQLVYKKYKVDDSHVAINDQFRQQLISLKNVPEKLQKTIRNIGYNEKDLVNFFNEYNHGSGDISNELFPVKKRDWFNLKLKSGLDYSSLSIENPSIKEWDIDFKHQTSAHFEIETEFILPFNKGKWSIFFDPGFQYYIASEAIAISVYSGTIEENVSVSYKSVELPAGLRYYFNLSDAARILIDFSFLIDIPVDQSIIKGKSRTLTIYKSSSFAGGAGLCFKRLNAEFRYSPGRDILNDYTSWHADFSKLSLVIGYQLL
jgi:hypothetical protein